MWSSDNGLGNLVGKVIERVFMNDEYLVFETDEGRFAFTVEGDCCSHSYFYDFHGVKKLLENGPVISVKEVDLGEDEKNDYDVTRCYGFQIFTESDMWGEQTSVFSFRNDSNGYYGGWMYATDADRVMNNITDTLPELTDDLLSTS
jgi:hypothetical protein